MTVVVVVEAARLEEAGAVVVIQQLVVAVVVIQQLVVAVVVIQQLVVVAQ